MEVTFDLPEELATRLRPHEKRLPHILELGLHAMQVSPSQYAFEEVDEVLALLSGSPSPEEVLAVCASPALQGRIAYLLEKNRSEGLSETEEWEWKRYEYAEHAVCLAKAKAHLTLQNARGENGHN
ncbi:MAG: hypothetical protein AAB354_15290 [candidate division KSB1 bacterium]